MSIHTYYNAKNRHMSSVELEWKLEQFFVPYTNLAPIIII